MDLGLRDRGVVITGGSRGLGRSIALRFAEEGASVAICARGERSLRAVETELQAHGVKTYAEACDVGVPAVLDAFLEHARNALGAVDILVNNASAFGQRDDEATWERSVQVDLMAAVQATRKVVPWLEERGGGAIIHISSVSGLEGGWPAPYSVAKAGLVSHAKAKAVELAPRRIRVNAVAPGSIEFPDGAWARVKERKRELYERVLATIPGGRMGTPDEVADAVAYLASARASWITGICLRVDGGQYRGNL
jgi:3-oxoacyl-[acyl-carrier protein] reductase